MRPTHISGKKSRPPPRPKRSMLSPPKPDRRAISNRLSTPCAPQGYDLPSSCAITCSPANAGASRIWRQPCGCQLLAAKTRTLRPGAHQLRSRGFRESPPGGRIRRKNSERCQAGRLACRVSDQTSVGHQYEDRQNSRPDHSSHTAFPRRRGDRVSPTLKRGKFITLLGGAAAVWPLAAHAQASKNIPRLCFLTFDPATSRSTRFDAFFHGLVDLGYVDGKTITIDYLSADGHGERFPTLVAECLRLKADIIAVSTTPATQAAKKATPTVPIVMIGLGDPVGTGLVESLAQPGGNVTGMSMMVPEVATKRLELLKEAVPGISRVLVLSYLADP